MKKNETAPVEFAAPGLPRIFAAMVYDSLLLAAISIAYGALVVAIEVAIFGQPDSGKRIQWNLPAQILITLGWLLTIMFFYIYFWQKFGQTLGMKTWRMQVVDASSNQLISYRQALKRCCAACLSLACLGAGYWLKLINPQGRLLHDLLSGTKLILLKKK
jgi:uncharacterized RDD family membrane protein YckC